MPNKEQPRPKKKKGNNYFDEKTQEAIVDFQNEPDIEERKRIFVARIQPAFSKLVENVIFVYKFHMLGNIDVLKNDCISFLFETITKFNASKGHKAFSYFNVVAKNWFIQKVKNYKKKNRTEISFDKDLIIKLENKNHQAVTFSFEDGLLKEEFIKLLKEETLRWRGKFEKEQEKKVLEAVIILLSNPDVIPLYNKKSIYLYIREMTGLNTKQVVTNLNKLKRKYLNFKKRYYNGEL